ncbi:VWA domain-containing protein [Bacteroidota bacterium]
MQKLRNPQFILSIILIAALFILASCKKDSDDTQAPPAPNLDKTYTMEKYLLNTEDPCFVNIMFQVKDGFHKGVSDLTTEDFEIFEDNQSVSPTESAMNVMQKDAIPYSLKTVLLIDNSASVGGNLSQIKAAAKSFVNSIVNKQKIAIYVFSDNTVLIKNFTNNKADLINAIDSIPLGFASTDLYGAVIEGVSKWNDSYTNNSINQGFLVMLTDGSDTQGSHTLNEAITARGEKKVYTIGLGSEIDESALQSIGNAGYFPIDNVSELSAKFSEIQSDISDLANSFYWLYYMSPKRGDVNHTLKVNIKSNLNGSISGFVTGNFNSNGFFSMVQSIMINHGVTQIVLTNDETYSMNAITYLPVATPQYTWTSSDNNVAKIFPDPSNSANAIITGVGTGGNTAVITCEDVANGLTTTVNVVVE